MGEVGKDVVEIMGRAAWQRETDRMDDMCRRADELVGMKVHAHSVGRYEDRNLLYEDMMQAALSALDAAGYAVVPKVPTEAMEKAGAQEKAMTCQRVQTCESDARDIYTAMLAASSNGRNG